MSKHTLNIQWQLQASDNFATGEFSREHEWRLDGGDILKASSSPMIIAKPYSSPEAIDPEEAFIGALASCHMMAFLAIVAKRKYIVTQYSDTPEGTLGNMANGSTGVSEVTLAPRVSFDGKQPSTEQLHKLHQMAHKACYIANSVKTDIRLNIVAL